MAEENLVRAAYVIIGDEILSGRTKDKNLNFLAVRLVKIGIALKEVRVIPDVEAEIIVAINDLRKKFDYVFTSGGIGPTHDDITAQAIAKAFGDNLIRNQEAENILIHHYGKDNLNNARLKMAYIPSKAALLDNPISSAPGFIIENVIVMAGVPKIMRAMFDAAKRNLKTGSKIYSYEIKVSLGESLIAEEFAILQREYPAISMGSYPFEEGTSLVFRGTELQLIEQAFSRMIDILNFINKKAIVSITK